VQSRTCNVRIVAATDVDLAAAVDAGDFRQDLFYSISVVPISLPPLRERAGDIPLLVEHFIRKHSPEANTLVSDISDEAMRKLLRYTWPGNIRQIEQVVRRALILSDGDTIQPDDLPLESPPDAAAQPSLTCNEQLPLEEVKTAMIEELERTYLDRVLRIHHGNVRHTARHAGLSERSISEKLKKYGLDRRTYEEPKAGTT